MVMYGVLASPLATSTPTLPEGSGDDSDCRALLPSQRETPALLQVPTQEWAQRETAEATARAEVPVIM